MIGKALQDQYNRFLHLNKTHSTEESLKIIAKSMRGCWFTRLLKEIYYEYPEIKDIQDKIQNYDISFLSQYFQGNTHQCSVCGRECLKIHDTCSIKCQAKSKKVIEKRKQTCLERFGTENAYQSEQIKEKIKQKNLERRGVEYARQVNILHYDQLNEKFVREHFIKDGKFLNNDFKLYFNLDRTYLSYKRKFNITEPNDNCKSLAEYELFLSIESENKIENDRTLIYPLELDIVLPNNKLAIEYNGLYYHSQFNNISKDYHLNKTLKCDEKGFQLFQIFENDNMNVWKAIINRKLGKLTEIDALDCKIKHVTTGIFDFISNNSLDQYINADTNIGLFYGNELVQLMCINNGVIVNNVINNNYSVINGTKVLVEYLNTDLSIKLNRRYNNGKDYEQIGFKLNNIIEPQKLNIKRYEIYDCGYLEYKYSR